MGEVIGRILFVEDEFVGHYRSLHLDLKDKGCKIEEGEGIFQHDNWWTEQKDQIKDRMKDIP